MNKANTKLKLIDSPVYNYWQALFKSFYSSRLYIDIGKRWKGLGLLYLLLLIAILTLPYSLKSMFLFSKDFDRNIIQPLKQLPPIYIQNGKVSIDKPTPYFIKNDENQVVIIIDTTGKITEFTDKYPHLNILVTKNKIMFNLIKPRLFAENNTKENKTPTIQAFSPTANAIFDGKKFAELTAITTIKLSSEIMFYPIFISLFYSLAIVMFLSFALFALFFTNLFFSFKLTYAKACRLLITAATPALLVLFIFMYLHLAFTGTGTIIFILIFGYYSFAVYSLKKESQRLVRKP